MPPYTPGSLSSEVFKVSADSGRRVFNVHSNILTAQSKPLAAIVSQSLAKSEERGIDLTDWDGDTVERFLDFLYSGNYKVTVLQAPNSAESSVTSSLGKDATEPIYTPSTSRSEKSYSDGSDTTVHEGNPAINLDRPLTPLWQFRVPIYDTEQGHHGVEENLSHSQSTEYSYEPVLLAHAKVYALAQYEEVETLQRLALQQLLTTLIPLESFVADSQVAVDVVNLLRFVYQKIKPLNPDGGDEPMLKMISQFAAINFPALEMTVGMGELLEQGGVLVTGLLRKVRRRLVNAENQLAMVKVTDRIFQDEALSLRLETSKYKAKIQDLEARVRDERKAREQVEKSITLLQNMLIAGNFDTWEQLQKLGVDMYQDVQVVTQKEFKAHKGHDLAYCNGREGPEGAKPKVYRVLKLNTARELLAMVALDLNVDALIRLWPMKARLNETIRPNRPFTTIEMDSPISDLPVVYTSLSEGQESLSSVRLWAEVADHVMPGTTPTQWAKDPKEDWKVIHLKHFDVRMQTLCGVGHEYIRSGDKVETLIPTIISRMGWESSQLVDLYEEIKPRMIDRMEATQTFSHADIGDGDIICFQKHYTDNERISFPGGYIFDARTFYMKII